MPCVVCGTETAEGSRVCAEHASLTKKEDQPVLAREEEMSAHEQRVQEFLNRLRDDACADAFDKDGNNPGFENLLTLVANAPETIRRDPSVREYLIFAYARRLEGTNVDPDLSTYSDRLDALMQFSEEEKRRAVWFAMENALRWGSFENAVSMQTNFNGPPLEAKIFMGALYEGLYENYKQELPNIERGVLDEREGAIWDFFADPKVPEEIKTAQETKSFLEHVDDQFYNLGLQHDPDVATALRARLTHRLSPIEFACLFDDAKMTDEEADRYQMLQKSRFGSQDYHFDDRRTLAKAIIVQDPKSSEVVQKIAEWRLWCEARQGSETAQSFSYLFNSVGAETLMEFLDRPDLSIHDAVQCDWHMQSYVYHNWPWGEGGPQYSEMHPKFTEMARGAYRSLMLQVAMDRSRYEVGDSYGEFTRILRDLGESNTTVADFIKAAKQLNIPGIDERIGRLQDPKYDPLRTWKGLRIVGEIKNIVGREHVLGMRNLPPALAEFTKGLMGSPAISMSAVEEFVRDPRAFLERTATYAEERSYAFAPARFAEVEHTGLTYEMVRDALFDGTLDRLQLLPPFEETFVVTEGGTPVTDASYTRTELVRALGKQSEDTKGEAQDVKGLFQRLQQWVVEYVKVSDKDEPLTMGGAAAILRRWVKDGVTPDVSSEGLNSLIGTEGLLYEKTIGCQKPKLVEIRTRVGAKSDPSIRAASEAVASCMPFGDGKTNTYDWNPAIAQLLVERRGEDGEWRAMAQSVLMIDHELHHGVDEKRNAADVINALRSGTAATDVLREEDLLAPRVLIADNIEPNKNEYAAGRAPVIEAAYRQFARSYLAQLPDGLNIDTGRLIVGKEFYGTERPDWSFKKEDNKYIPGSPVSYMDAVGREVYEVPVEGAPKKEIERLPAGIVDIDASHVLAMSFLEGKGFQENAGLIFGLADRYKRILGTSIARERFGDPDFMFMSRGAGGKMEGYMMARVNHETDLPEVYIDDIAVDRTRGLASGRAAMRLIDTFLERYFSAYESDEALMPPIAAEMREATSYQLVTRKIDQIVAKTGKPLVYEIVERGETSMGGETFKSVRIFIGRTREEVDQQKERFARSTQ